MAVGAMESGSKVRRFTSNLIAAIDQIERKEESKVLTNMKILPLYLSTILLGVASVVHAEPEIKGSPTELAQYIAGAPRLASLSGESELKVSADRALISLKVVTENKSLQEATRMNRDVRAQMLKTLTERGVAADRVQPSRFSSTPKYGVFSEKAKSYRVENVVKIKAQDEKEFQTVASLVDSMPEVRYDGVEFEHSDKAGLKKKAIQQAMEKIAEKKKLYEEALGVKLTVKGFSEGVVATPIAVDFQAGYLRNSYSSDKSRAPTFETADGAAGEGAPTSFGELVFIGRVTVDYLVDAK